MLLAFTLSKYVFVFQIPLSLNARLIMVIASVRVILARDTSATLVRKTLRVITQRDHSATHSTASILWRGIHSYAILLCEEFTPTNLI